MRKERPGNDKPFNLGGCFWLVNNGRTRFFQGARPELSDVPVTQKIQIIVDVNNALVKKAEILSAAGVPLATTGITGAEMHYPNEIDQQSFGVAVKALRDNNMVASMVTANLFYTFPNGALSSTDPAERARAIQWAKDTVDLGYQFEEELGYLPTNVFWPGNEGVQCVCEKDIVLALHLYGDSMNQIMEHEYKKPNGGRMLFAGEAKPNEPKDTIILPTTADFLAFMQAALKPEFWKRFGVNPETAHEMLANMSPISAVALALALGRLFHYHANWQKGLKWDQDNGVPVNLAMLEVVHYMKQYGFNGFIGFDIQARPESKQVGKVLEYSAMNLRLLEALDKRVDWGHIDELRKAGTPEMAEQYVQMCLMQMLPQNVDVRALI